MNTKLNQLTIRGFKSIKKLDTFDLRNINILIGANGTGKSNFIDFFRMIRAMMSANLGGFTEKHGGADGFCRLRWQCLRLYREQSLPA